jgi:hypothetical protein
MTGGPRFWRLRAKETRYRASVWGSAMGRVKSGMPVESERLGTKLCVWGAVDAMGKRGQRFGIAENSLPGPGSVTILPMQWCAPLLRQHAGKVVEALAPNSGAASVKLSRSAIAMVKRRRIFHQRIRESTEQSNHAAWLRSLFRI